MTIGEVVAGVCVGRIIQVRGWTDRVIVVVLVMCFIAVVVVGSVTDSD